jgi:hypothetical protein
MDVIGEEIASTQQHITAAKAEIQVAELKLERVEGQIEDVWGRNQKSQNQEGRRDLGTRN